MNKKDILLILITLLVSGVLIFINKLNYKKSNYAYVYYENKVIKEIDLSINDTYTVKGYNGSVVIEVKDNMIRVKEETSKYHICSKQGFVKDNTPIICMPNKIIIKMDKLIVVYLHSGIQCNIK